MTQENAFSILTSGANVFLTGEPGSGKTHTVNRFVAWLHDNRVNVAVTASTGIAATHIGGMTVHSWSGIGIKRALSKDDLVRIAGNARTARRIRNAHVLIIDEVSMLSGETLSMVEAVCRTVRKSSRPFGALQVVLVGDFFQLPPIVSREIKEEAVELGQSPLDMSAARGAPSVWAFDSAAWKALSPTVCYLSEQHRHDDPAFVELLSAIRCGTVTDDHREVLASRRPDAEVSTGDGEGPRETAADSRGRELTRLYSHNTDVDRINTQRLIALAGKEHSFTMQGFGASPLIEQLKRGCLSPERLVIKVSARVMFTKNDPRMRFVNGTIGTVAGFDKESGYPIIETRGGRSVVAEPVSWAIEGDGRALAEVVQIPLRLAWAITVHKSQGMSLDAARMDLSDAFEYGQGYVALSRLRRLDGLTLEGLNERALEVHPAVQAKDEEFRTASDAVDETLAALPPGEMENRRRSFLCDCGAGEENVYGAEPIIGYAVDSVAVDDGEESDVVGVRTVRRGPAQRGKKSHGGKADTYAVTLSLLRQGKSAAAVAKERGLTLGTIVGHIEKHAARNTLLPEDAAAAILGFEKDIALVHEAFAKVGAQRLSPVFEYLHGAVPFETIRLAMLTYRNRKKGVGDSSATSIVASTVAEGILPSVDEASLAIVADETGEEADDVILF